MHIKWCYIISVFSYNVRIYCAQIKHNREMMRNNTEHEMFSFVTI